MVSEKVKERRPEVTSARPSGFKPCSGDDLTCEEEIHGTMTLAEISLAEFLDDEPDLYSLKDLKVKYK